MSGGSYNYFYGACAEDLRRMASTVASMSERCATRSAGPPEKHWKTATDLDLAALGECAVYLQAISLRLQGMATLMAKWEDVTHDIEWWASGDYGIESTIKSFKKLIAERTATRSPSERAVTDRDSIAAYFEHLAACEFGSMLDAFTAREAMGYAAHWVRNRLDEVHHAEVAANTPTRE